MNSKAIWFAFAIGVSAGASIALLYAPQSGDRTRKKLKRSIDDAGDRFGDAGDYLRKEAEKLSADAQDTLKKSKGQLSDALDSASSYATSAVKQAKSLV